MKLEPQIIGVIKRGDGTNDYVLLDSTEKYKGVEFDVIIIKEKQTCEELFGYSQYKNKN